MCGLDLDLKCKECGHESYHNIGITPLYSINGSKVSYIPVKCDECGKLHYVAETSNIVEKDTPEEREKLYKQREKIWGKSERLRQRFLEEEVVVERDKAVYTENEVESIEQTGACCF